MVWASQEPADDSVSGIDTVRAKPLKKRCGSRAGLSRYYSSKSQSFSSLELVQCTQFGTSARALSKRPSSFDLHRSSPRAVTGLRHVGSSGVRSTCQVEEASMCLANEDVGDCGGVDTPTRCPCNDTIFADPAEGFISPEGSPSANASPLQLYGICGSSLSAAGITPYQQQRHCQLTAEYLTHLSGLLPLQLPIAASGGGELCTAHSGSCCSSSNSGSDSGSSSNSSSTNTSSFCDSAFLTTTRQQRQLAAADSGVAAAADHAPGSEAATHALLQACSEEVDLRNACLGIGSTCARLANSCAGSGGAGGTTLVMGYQNTSTCVTSGSSSTFANGASHPRNCLRPGGYFSPAFGGIPIPAVAEPPCAGGGGSNAGGGGSALLGRKLGLGFTHRRFRAAQAAGLVAVHSARHAAAGLWVSTEEMVAALTLGDRQMPPQQLSAARAPSWPAPQSGGGGGSFGPCYIPNSGTPCRQQQPLAAVAPPAMPAVTVPAPSSRGNDGGSSPGGIPRPSCGEPGSRHQHQQQHHHQLQHLLLHQQHQQQWLCGSAPAGSLTFGL